MRRTQDEFKKWITDEIKRFAREDPDNRFKLLDGSYIFDEPLVGFVAGNDPIFYQLKEVIGEFHLTPYEAMSRIAEKKGIPVSEEEVGVISYILPISKKTREENAKMTEMPSERWANTRLFGEDFNKKLQRHLVALLEKEGYFAVAPETEKEELFHTMKDDRVGYASTWSQRHVAFIAGLGTFGLSDGLITKVGKAHRCGSVIINQPLDSPQRREINETNIHWDCLYYQNGGCMQCVDRCPVGAISEEEGHDKNKCSEHIFKKTTPFVKENYGIDIYGCGLCQTDVPCEEESPVNEEK